MLTGEVAVQGKSAVALGRWNRDSQLAAAFVRDTELLGEILGQLNAIAGVSVHFRHVLYIDALRWKLLRCLLINLRPPAVMKSGTSRSKGMQAVGHDEDEDTEL